MNEKIEFSDDRFDEFRADMIGLNGNDGLHYDLPSSSKEDKVSKIIVEPQTQDQEDV